MLEATNGIIGLEQVIGKSLSQVKEWTYGENKTSLNDKNGSGSVRQDSSCEGCVEA